MPGGKPFSSPLGLPLTAGLGPRAMGEVQDHLLFGLVRVRVSPALPNGTARLVDPETSEVLLEVRGLL